MEVVLCVGRWGVENANVCRRVRCPVMNILINSTLERGETLCRDLRGLGNAHRCADKFPTPIAVRAHERMRTSQPEMVEGSSSLHCNIGGSLHR